MKRYYVCFLVLAVILIGCGKSTVTHQVIETVTKTILPTNRILIHTGIPTITPSLTATIRPTKPPTPTAPTKTPTPTVPTRTPIIPWETRSHWTSTPQPPLQAHSWEVEQVLVQVEAGGGDGCCRNVDAPEFVLYANGLFIKPVENRSRIEMYGRILDRQEICALLNTIDQIGFLDYDPSIYQDPMDGAGSTFITVNAWKTQFIYGQFLHKWVYEGGDWWSTQCPRDTCSPPPIILPALSNTVKLLDNYNPGGLKRIPAEKLVIWPIPAYDEELVGKVINTWPIPEMTLLSIAEASGEDMAPVIISTPELVKKLWGCPSEWIL